MKPFGKYIRFSRNARKRGNKGQKIGGVDVRSYLSSLSPLIIETRGVLQRVTKVTYYVCPTMDHKLAPMFIGLSYMFPLANAAIGSG